MTTKRHACLTRVDEHLKQFNTRLHDDLFVPNRVFIETMPIKPKRGQRRKHMLATFCPFCGKKLK